MKKYVMVLSLVLLLLVSCATKKTKQEVLPESVETTVVEQLPQPVSEPETEITPAEEKPETVQQESASAETASEPEVAVTEEVTTADTTTEKASEEAPVTDWGYVFTSPASSDSTQPEKAEEVKTAVSKPKATVVEEDTEPQKPSFITKVAYFVAHETLFSLGLLVSLGGLIYFIVALIKSSGMIEKKKPVVREEEPTEEKSPSKEDVEPQDTSSGFDPEDENDEFLRALLGEDKK